MLNRKEIGLAQVGGAANNAFHPTALRARKSAASRAFSVLCGEVAHAEPARRVNAAR